MPSEDYQKFLMEYNELRNECRSLSNSSLLFFAAMVTIAIGILTLFVKEYFKISIVVSAIFVFVGFMNMLANLVKQHNMTKERGTKLDDILGSELNKILVEYDKKSVLINIGKIITKHKLEVSLIFILVIMIFLICSINFDISLSICCC